MPIDIGSLKIIIPVNRVPNGKQVRKVKGSKVYIVRDSISFFGPPRQEIKATKGTRLLISQSGDSHCVPGATEVVVTCSYEQIQRILDQKRNDPS